MSTSNRRQNAMYFFKNVSTSPSFSDKRIKKEPVSSYPSPRSSYKKKEQQVKGEKTSPPRGSYPSSTTRSSDSEIKKELPTPPRGCYPLLSHLLSTPQSSDSSYNSSPPGGCYPSWTPRSINKKELESPTKGFLETENELMKKQFVKLYEMKNLEEENLKKENQKLMEQLKEEKEKMNKMKNLNVVLKQQYQSLDSTREEVLHQLMKENDALKQKIKEDEKLETCNKKRISELSIANTELYSQLEKQYYRYSHEWQQELDLLCDENNRLSQKLIEQNIELQKLHKVYDEMKVDLMKNHKTKIEIEEMNFWSNKRKCPW